jgi:hypothetical protein
MNNKPKTIICDIDGVLLYHKNEGLSAQVRKQKCGQVYLLEGAVEKINEWDLKGYNLILITGRRESQRRRTEKQLSSFGIFYDHLIMGVGGGDRVIINDKKPNKEGDTALAINLKRNEGLKNVKL